METYGDIVQQLDRANAQNLRLKAALTEALEKLCNYGEARSQLGEWRWSNGELIIKEHDLLAQ